MKHVLKAIVHEVQAVQTIGANATKKQTVILMVPGYTDSWGEKQGNDEHWPVDIIGENVTKLNLSQSIVGKKIEAEIFINGKQYDKSDGSGKGYFISANLKSYKIVEQKKDVAPAPQQAVQQPMDVSTTQDDTPDWLK